MEPATNKYSQFKMKTLLDAVQKAGFEFSDPKFRGKLTTTHRNKIISDVKKLQDALIPKLNAIDRMTVSFFPPGSHIEHQQVQSQEDLMDFSKVREPSRFGTVVGHEGNKVLVQLEGVTYFVRADPGNLRLRFIRSII